MNYSTKLIYIKNEGRGRREHLQRTVQFPAGGSETPEIPAPEDLLPSSITKRNGRAPTTESHLPTLSPEPCSF